MDVVYLLYPTSNHNRFLYFPDVQKLYIFCILHQTTTFFNNLTIYACCISFVSYIKPQRLLSPHNWLKCCISFVSYIKPQLPVILICKRQGCISFVSYIKPQQTCHLYNNNRSCISFVSYIKPQLSLSWVCKKSSCISFVSYIKPQLSQPGTL